eukprot:TRINITY_DN16106_c0_g1_i1.p1 TRINITY_DN16106_c0_g1~~TRINITY_DN16106_c0_g1_i1.p1  ORF type:complete len:905 (+),score=319.01 TRINITY_DN16106_c0_g1_i1:696-3410(+)
MGGEMLVRLMVVCSLLCVNTGARSISSKKEFDCKVEDMKSMWVNKDTLLVNCMLGDGLTHGREGALWHSDDAGGSWNRVDVGFCTNPDMCIFGFVEEDENHGYLITKYGGAVWDRGDGNVYTSRINGRPLFLGAIIPHPDVAHNGRVLGLNRVNEAGCDEHYDCPSMLYYSTDYGKSFKLILDGKFVWEVSWGAPGGQYYDPDEIFMIIKKGSSTTGEWAPKDWNWLETYNLETHETKKVLHDASYFLNVGRYTYYLVEGKVRKELHMSSTNGRVVVKTEFPSDKPQESWRIILSNDGATFVAVYHSDCTRDEYVTSWGTLYQSDATGEDFVVSIENIRWGLETHQPDFHKAGGIDGVFIANSVLVEEEACKMCKTQESCISDCRYVTRISFSNGDPETWRPIPAPADIASECKSKDDCYLHLHNFASEQDFIPAILSRHNSPGIIMGVGNIGDSLDVTGMNADVFLTINGGQSWRRIFKGPHVYDWSNFGGFIVVVEGNKPVQDFYFSLDMGTTFDKVRFTEEDHIVVYKVEAAGGMWSEGQSTMFTLYSYNTETSSTAVWRLELDQFKGEPCAQPTKIEGGLLDGKDPNFVAFKRNITCFMGAEIEYIQKRAGSKCWNTATETDVEQHWTLMRCGCNMGNYECDHGFRWVDGKCASEVTKEVVFDLEKLAFVTEKDHHPPAECNDGYYPRKTGYVLRPGHKCDVGSLNLLPIPTKCLGSSSKSKGSWFGTLLLLLFLLVVFSVMGVYIAAFLGNPTAYGIKLLIEEKFEWVTNPFVSYMAVRRVDPDSNPEVDHDHMGMDLDEFDDNDEYVGGTHGRHEVAAEPQAPQPEGGAHNEPPEHDAAFSSIPIHVDEHPAEGAAAQQAEGEADNPFLDFQAPPQDTIQHEPTPSTNPALFTSMERE